MTPARFPIYRELVGIIYDIFVMERITFSTRLQEYKFEETWKMWKKCISSQFKFHFKTYQDDFVTSQLVWKPVVIQYWIFIIFSTHTFIDGFINHIKYFYVLKLLRDSNAIVWNLFFPSKVKDV